MMSNPPFYGNLKLTDFLKRIWNLSQMPSTDSRFDDAEGDIWQHMINNEDWTFDYLLDDYLKLMTAEDELFLKFLGACVHPILRTDPRERQQRLVRFNELLKPDGFELVASTEISGQPVYEAKRIAGNGVNSDAYEVVLSFAGEQRDYVREAAGYLRAVDVAVFYDEYEEAGMWGKSLVEHLQEVYGGVARYCVMFISKEYAEKVWSTVERRAAFAKAVQERQEYILPYRFDDTKIPGLNSDVVYLRNKTARELAEVILKKLGRSRSLPPAFSNSSDVEVIKAEWGVDGDMREVTKHLVRLLQAKTKDLKASIRLFRDDHHGENKILIVEYRRGDGDIETIVFEEGDPIFFPA